MQQGANSVVHFLAQAGEESGYHSFFSVPLRNGAAPEEQALLPPPSIENFAVNNIRNAKNR
jgi:hypothetical protein